MGDKGDNKKPSKLQKNSSARSKAKQNAYASFDIETDGNNPMQYNMRSLGVALYLENKMAPFATFYIRVEPFYQVEIDPKCKTFWEKHQKQWADLQVGARPVGECMQMLSTWLTLHAQKYTIKWVANPANFDWMFLKCNYETHGPTGKYDIGFFCHDLSSLLRTYLLIHNITDKSAFTNQLSGQLKYTHHALDDALYQGRVYMKLRKLIRQDSLVAASTQKINPSN